MIEPETIATDLDASFAFCRRLAKRTAKNFYYSFLTLPSDVRRDMCALYAYMRVCDDLGDDTTVPLERRRANLATWREAVAAALDSEPSGHAVLPALMDVVRRRKVPREPLLEVINGIEMDLSPVEFQTFEELENYCYHVAGTVGLCCISIWGYDGDMARQHAIECGLAFQLTNILRDLAEDAGNGRCYLPGEDLERFDYSRNDLARGVQDERYRRLMAFQVARAREYYESSRPLAGSLEPAGRPVLLAMRRIYGGLLDEIERRDYDVFTRRIRLPRWKKLAIAAKSYWRPIQDGDRS